VIIRGGKALSIRETKRWSHKSRSNAISGDLFLPGGGRQLRLYRMRALRLHCWLPCELLSGLATSSGNVKTRRLSFDDRWLQQPLGVSLEGRYA